MGGPVTVERAPFRTPLGEAFVAAGETLGYPRGDYNGHLQTRFDVPQGTVQNGKRVSTSKAFLHTARYRPNLHILTNAKVLKVSFIIVYKRRLLTYVNSQVDLFKSDLSVSRNFKSCY